MNESLEIVTVIAKLLQDVQIYLQEYFKNSNNNFEERWEVFIKAINSNIYRNINYYWECPEMYELGYDNPYDDLNCEKYEEMNFLKVIDRLNEKFDHKNKEELINKIKEKMLISGYSGFCYDW